MSWGFVITFEISIVLIWLFKLSYSDYTIECFVLSVWEKLLKWFSSDLITTMFFLFALAPRFLCFWTWLGYFTLRGLKQPPWSFDSYSEDGIIEACCCFEENWIWLRCNFFGWSFIGGLVSCRSMPICSFGSSLYTCFWFEACSWLSPLLDLPLFDYYFINILLPLSPFMTFLP